MDKYNTKQCHVCNDILELNKNNFYRDSRSKDGYRATCITCFKKRRKILKEENKNKVAKPYIEGHKYCSKCERSLPMDVAHFSRSSNISSGFYSACKECRGSSFGVKQPNRVWKAREGYKICGKCLKELPLDDDHFYKSSQKKDGRETNCKVCRGAPEYGVRNKNRVFSYGKGKKMCTVCCEILSKNKFSKMTISTDGLSSRCKVCDAVLRKEYLSRPEVQIAKAKYDKAWRKAYYSTDIGRTKVKINSQIRKSRIANTIYNYSSDIWEDTLKHFNYSCAYCGEKHDVLHQEHVIPVSKGGYYNRQNIIPACQHCNISKNNRDLLNWYPKQKNFSQNRLDKINRWTGTKNNMQQLSIL